MSATEIINELQKLPAKEREEVFVYLASEVIGKRSDDPKRWLGKKLSFEEACDVVFRENRELLSLLAK